MTIAAVITAGGSSSRMGTGQKKEYRPLPGAVDAQGRSLSVLAAVTGTFLAVPKVERIVIVHPPEGGSGEGAARAALGNALFEKAAGRLLFVPGGATRQESVRHALALLNVYQPDYALIHDGARPWVTTALIDSVIAAMLQYGAAIPTLPLREAPRVIEGGFVCRHLRRASIAAAQTPQGFSFGPLFAAHETAAGYSLRDGIAYTDDAEIYGAFAGKVAVVAGETTNLKITFASDLLDLFNN